MEMIIRWGIGGKEMLKNLFPWSWCFFGALDDVEHMLFGVAHYGRGVVYDDFGL